MFTVPYLFFVGFLSSLTLIYLIVLGYLIEGLKSARPDFYRIQGTGLQTPTKHSKDVIYTIHNPGAWRKKPGVGVCVFLRPKVDRSPKAIDKVNICLLYDKCYSN